MQVGLCMIRWSVDRDLQWAVADYLCRIIFVGGKVLVTLDTDHFIIALYIFDSPLGDVALSALLSSNLCSLHTRSTCMCFGQKPCFAFWTTPKLRSAAACGCRYLQQWTSSLCVSWHMVEWLRKMAELTHPINVMQKSQIACMQGTKVV